jgi:hypothetical protein
VIPPSEDAPLTVHVIAPIPLFTIVLLSVSHDFMTLTLGTLYCYNRHICSCSKRFATVISLALSTVLVSDIEQVLREKKSFTLRCVLDCIKELQGRVAIWNRCASSVSIISA